MLQKYEGKGFLLFQGIILKENVNKVFAWFLCYLVKRFKSHMSGLVLKGVVCYVR